MEPFARLNAIRDSAGFTSSQKLVLYALALRSDATGRSFPSYELLGKDTAMNRTTVIRVVKELVEMGVLRCEKRLDDSGDSTSNLYVLDVDRVVAQRNQVVASRNHLSGDWVVASRNPGGGTTRLGVVASRNPGGGVVQPEQYKEQSTGTDQVTDHPPFALQAQGVSSTKSPSKPKKQAASKRRTKPEEPTPEGYSDVIARFCALFEAKKGCKPSGKKSMARNGKAAKDLLAAHSLAEVLAMIDRAFADPWTIANQPNLWSIANNPDRLRGRVTNASGGGRAMQPPPQEQPEWMKLPEAAP